MRPSKTLNNIVEQDHRAIERIARPMLGFETFRCARILIAGIEVSHMIRKGQLADVKDQASSQASQFYSLAFDARRPRGRICPHRVVATKPFAAPTPP